MPKYLVTASLLNSYLYMMNSSEEYEDKAKADFLGMLRKDEFVSNEYIRSGFKFEDDVKALAYDREIDDQDENYVACVREAAEIVKNGMWQVGGSYHMDVGGDDIVLYARVDVLKAGVAYDLKRVHRTPTIPKFSGSAQHRIYLLAFPGVEKAEYIICDGSRLYREEYRSSEHTDIHGIMDGFMRVVKSNDEYMTHFYEKWRSVYQ